MGTGKADGLAAGLADAVGDPDPLAPAEPLAAAELLGTAVGLGSGKIRLGSFANASTNISTKMTTTISTHGFARLSVRGGNAPR